jgi:light-independent protochlorophyllide reductase subunit B
MMGLEEHLLTMFRGDFEFHDGAAPSHLQHGASGGYPRAAEASAASGAHLVGAAAAWSLDAERELKRIPFFVRGKARRNTELFAKERGIQTIDLETLYDAKAHFGR